MLLGQLRHGLGMRIRRAQLPLSLQLVWRWVLWCEQPVRLAEPHGCGLQLPAPRASIQGAPLTAERTRSRGFPGSSQHELCAHLVVHISPCNRIWFRERFLIYPSTSSGGCGNGLCHGPRLQGSVIIGGYWHLSSMTLLTVNYWTDFGHCATKAVIRQNFSSYCLRMLGPWDSCPHFSKELSNFSCNQQAVCVS